MTQEESQEDKTLGRKADSNILDKAIEILKSPMAQRIMPAVKQQAIALTIKEVSKLEGYTVKGAMEAIPPKMKEIYKLAGVTEEELKKIVEANLGKEKRDNA